MSNENLNKNNNRPKFSDYMSAFYNASIKQAKFWINRAHSAELSNLAKGFKEITPSQGALIGGISKTWETKDLKAGAAYTGSK